MAITVQCSQCGTIVAAPDSAAGKKGRCTVCGMIVDLPAPFASPPPPEREPVLVAESRRVQQPPKAPAASAVARAAPPPPAPKVNADLMIAALKKGRQSGPSLAERLAQPPPPPDQKKSWCAVAALASLAIMTLTVTAVAVVLFVYVLPAFERAKDVVGESAIQRIELAQQAYFEKSGEFAQRISGKVKSLESAGVIAIEDAAAEAPPGPGRPLRGYLYRILTQQGKSGPGGAKSFIDAGGKMTGGYAILVYPAEAAAAKKTFLRGPDGKIYSKDFGSETAAEVGKIKSFDVDKTWTPVTAPAVNAAGDRAKEF